MENFLRARYAAFVTSPAEKRDATSYRFLRLQLGRLSTHCLAVGVDESHVRKRRRDGGVMHRYAEHDDIGRQHFADQRVK